MLPIPPRPYPVQVHGMRGARSKVKNKKLVNPKRNPSFVHTQPNEARVATLGAHGQGLRLVFHLIA